MPLVFYRTGHNFHVSKICILQKKKEREKERRKRKEKIRVDFFNKSIDLHPETIISLHAYTYTYINTIYFAIIDSLHHYYTHTHTLLWLKYLVELTYISLFFNIFIIISSFTFFFIYILLIPSLRHSF